jgi:hypothetical protein
MEQAFDLGLGVNVKGAIFPVQKALPLSRSASWVDNGLDRNSGRRHPLRKAKR